MKRYEFVFSSSQSKGKYEVATGVLKSPDELVDMYQTLISKYPVVLALINPFRREVSSKNYHYFVNISKFMYIDILLIYCTCHFSLVSAPDT